MMNYKTPYLSFNNYTNHLPITFSWPRKISFWVVVFFLSFFISNAQVLLKDFQVQTNGRPDINAIEQDKDGNYLLAGNFDVYQNFSGSQKTVAHSIIKVDDNGELVKSFSSPFVDGIISKIKIQIDGAILIIGNFAKVNGVARNKIARLNSDGSLDPNFSVGHQFLRIYNVGIQSDSKLVLLGDVGLSNSLLIRVNSNGTIDSSFNTELESVFAPHLLLVDNKDRIIIAGSYFDGNSNSFAKIIRLQRNGSNDPNFQHGYFYSQSIQLLGDMIFSKEKQIIVVGGFDKFNETLNNKVALIDTLGNIQKDFALNIGSGIDQYITSVGIFNDGKIGVTGMFTNYYGAPANIILFDRFGRFNSIVALTSNNNNNMCFVDSNNRLLMAGTYNFVYGPGFSYIAPRRQIARFNLDFSIDENFRPILSSISRPISIAVQPNGNITIGCNWYDFVNPKTGASEPFLRINKDGSLNRTFSPNAIFTNAYSLQSISNDQILAGGFFSSINGNSYKGIIAMNNDGSIVESFAASRKLFSQLSEDPTVAKVKYIGNKIYAAGILSGCDTHLSNSIIKLNLDGTPSTDFSSQLPENSNINNFVVLPDESIIASGYFPFNQSTFEISFLVRLNKNGAVDRTFPLYKEPVEDVAVDLQGKILIAGHNKVVKLLPSGLLDNSFKSVSFTGGYVVINKIRIVDKNIFISGNFNTVNGNPSNAIALLDSNGNFIPMPNLSLSGNSKINDATYIDQRLYLTGGIFSDDFQSSVAIIDFGPPVLSKTYLTLESEAKNTELILKWSANSYNNVSGYTIERTSLSQSLIFSLLDSIKTPNTLSYIDRKANMNEEYFYRVAAYNSRGNSNYSNVVKGLLVTEVTNEEQLMIYPNPAITRIVITLPETESLSRCTATSMTGQTLLLTEIEVFNRNSTIDMSNLTSGVYILTIETTNGSYKKKIVKL